MKRLRGLQGLSAEQVALAAGVPASTYREWENGRGISGQPYLRIAKALGVSLATLFGVEDRSRDEIFSEILRIEGALKEIKQRL